MSKSFVCYIRNSYMFVSNRGFSLIELLISISIIGILSSVVLAGLFTSTEKARISQTLNNIREMEKAIRFYILDTNQVPTACIVSCDDTNDPFLNSLGVLGWGGPYMEQGVHGRTHPWGGQLGLVNDGGEIYVVINDDPPNANNNSGRVPTEVLITMDEILDDGNLGTGLFVGDGVATVNGIGVVGEAIYRVTSP